MVNFGGLLKDHFSKNSNFRSFGVRYSDIKDKDVPLLKIGINALDDGIAGIMQNEVVLIGADSGVGKTEIGIIIAASVAQSDNAVVLFSLESYDGEIEDRRKFSEILQKTTFWNGPIFFKKWVSGKYPELVELEKTIKVDPLLEKNLFLRYRKMNEDYTIANFEADIDYITQCKDLKLIVLDHLHFFTLDDDKSENKELTKIIKKIRDIALLKNIPIVLIAHLRKNKNLDSLVPDYSEFHGSSEIFKNATTIVTMAPDFETTSADNMFPTLFRICKDRFGTVANKFLMGCLYDARRRIYCDGYKLYKLKKNGREKELLEKDNRPIWAKNAKD